MDNYTVVLGVDAKHLAQLSWSSQSWERHKSRLWGVPWCVFYDHEEVTEREIRAVIQHDRLSLVPWPPEGVTYEGDPDGEKWQKPKRYRMLSGFLHVPAMCVTTRYWLKLDTDVIATGLEDWIDDCWFDGEPVIVAHRWGFTKPADQMLVLDEWVKHNGDALAWVSSFPPLKLYPSDEGASRLTHARIISWCAFINTEFNRFCSECALRTMGQGKMPVPSQDGYVWYMATRLRHRVLRTNMRARGWQQWSSDENVRQAVIRALQ